MKHCRPFTRIVKATKSGRPVAISIRLYIQCQEARYAKMTCRSIARGFVAKPRQLAVRVWSDETNQNRFRRTNRRRPGSAGLGFSARRAVRRVVPERQESGRRTD